MRSILMMSLLFFFWSCTSCNSEDPSSDTDSGLTDSDVTIQDNQSDPDILKSDKDTEESDEDRDDSNEEETSDYDYPSGEAGNVDCPSLYNPGFPYRDKDGKITFCRTCDLPAPTNDPQCVRNLWEMNNRAIMEEYPEYYCYPLPCDMTDKLYPPPEYIEEKCDSAVTGKVLHNSTGVFKQGDIWEGKVGMYATAGKSVDGKYIVKGSLLYEIGKGKYTMVAYSSEKMAYKYDRFLFIAGNTFDGRAYILSAKKVETGWKYEIAYDNGVYRSNFIYPPAVGENYVLINVENVDGNSAKEILYASVNDWKWTKLGEGIIYYPQIHEDTAFFATSSGVWACDLNKSLTDIENGCRKVNREGEKASAPFPKKGESNLVAYIGGDNLNKFAIADISKNPVEYKDLNLQPQSTDLISYTSGQWDGDIIVFSELYQYSEVDVDYRICYYSISKDKKVCFPNTAGGRMGNVFGGVEGKYITYQPTGTVILRDMECYCKEHPDYCLYDEFLPDEVPDEDVILDSDVVPNNL